MLQDEERGVGRRKQLRVYAQFSVLDACCARARGPGVPVRRPARLGAGVAATGSPARGYGERTAGWECAQGHSPPTAGSTSGSSKYPTRCICRVEIKRSAASCPTLPRATSATSSVAPLNAGAAPAPAALNGISHANFPAPPPSLFSGVFAVPARTRPVKLLGQKMEGVYTIPDRSAPTDLRGCGGGPCGRRGARLAPRCGARRAPEDPLPWAGTVRHVLHVFSRRMHHLLTAPADALRCAGAGTERDERARMVLHMYARVQTGCAAWSITYMRGCSMVVQRAERGANFRIESSKNNQASACMRSAEHWRR